MKSLILVVGTLAALAAPAVAGAKKKPPPAAKPATTKVAIETASASAASPSAALQPAAASQPVASSSAAAPLAEALDIPALQPDLSSPLEPMTVAKPMSKATKERPVVVKTGGDYALGRRQSAKPEREYEAIIPKSLNQAQVATVVQAHMGDVRNCWDLVAKADRADACTAQLKLSISDSGAVTAIELGGDVPASARECMTSAVSKWTFPAAETRTEIEYGISLRSL